MCGWAWLLWQVGSWRDFQTNAKKHKATGELKPPKLKGVFSHGARRTRERSFSTVQYSTLGVVSSGASYLRRRNDEGSRVGLQRRMVRSRTCSAAWEPLRGL